MLGIEKRTSTNIKVLWDFEGIMRFYVCMIHIDGWELANGQPEIDEQKYTLASSDLGKHLSVNMKRYSPLFYGFYANQPQSRSGYQVQS